ncbi:MAG TPA: hypothetical protein VKE70_28590, partial [Candidatus Solibacter sp.]|nr:hypothetical protein [Candidatus Solibacter sp.]
AQTKKLEKRYIERLRKKVFELVSFGLPTQVDQDDFDITAELPEDLPAGAAGRGECVGIGGDDDAAELSDAFTDRLEYCDPLGTDSQSVSGVLDIAPGVDAPVGTFERCANLEVRKHSVRIGANGERRIEEKTGVRRNVPRFL